VKEEKLMQLANPENADENGLFCKCSENEQIHLRFF